MMLGTSRSCRILCSKPRLDTQRITNAVYVAILIYLILYSIFNTVYLDVVSRQPHEYDIENVAVRPIACSVPVSGQYQQTPRYICYFLLVFTVVIRNHEWLAAGAAASVLTYSGLAAIHWIILFATNSRFNMPKTKTHCESVPIPNLSTPFLACAGVNGPDQTLAMAIVSTAMFGALPTAAWSTAFRKSRSKPILIFWIFLLAVGRTFWNVITPDLNLHF